MSSPGDGERRPLAGGTSRLAAAAILAVVAAVVLGACSGSGATPAPSIAPAPGGVVTSQAFQPAVTVTLPPGWQLAQDTPDYLLLRPAGSETLGIHLFRDPLAASQDAACPAVPEPGVAGASVALSGWLRQRPGLVVSDARLAAVGGLRGLVHDIGIASDLTASCPFANGLPTVPLLVSSKPNGFHWVMAGGERLRLYLLDVPGGGLVAVDVDDFAGDAINDLVGQSLPIIESMSFALPTASPGASVSAPPASPTVPAVSPAPSVPAASVSPSPSP